MKYFKLLLIALGISLIIFGAVMLYGSKMVSPLLAISAGSFAILYAMKL